MTKMKYKVIFLYQLMFTVLIVTVRGKEEVCQKTGTQYQGTRSFTASGLTCIPWESISPALSASQFPEATVKDASNYCRNPENKANGKPWCYTDATTKTFGACNIETCDGKTGDLWMTEQQCITTPSFLGFENGDVKRIFSKSYPSRSKGMKYPGCTVKLEGCKRCRYYVKIQATLPVCRSDTTDTLKCPTNCQSVAVFDGPYNETLGKVFVRKPGMPGMPETLQETYWTVSNLVHVRYCQRNSEKAEQLASFAITVYTTTKEQHFSSESGVIKSPNFPYGYFSRSEIYEYSVQSPVIDANVTLIFYDWDLNASANSKITIRSGLVKLGEFTSKSVRPALLIPSTRFTMTFETGSIINWRQDQKVGFVAEYNKYTGADWEEKPDTSCGGYLPVSESYGGKIEYDKKTTNDTYIDCIWVIEIPKPYTNLQYQVEYKKDPEAQLNLDLRDGVTSVDPKLGNKNRGSVRKRGIFVHLSGSYRGALFLKMSYVSYTHATKESQCKSIPGAFYCAEYSYCLDTRLFQQWGIAKCKLDPPVATVSPVLCNAYRKLACKDKSKCYTTLQQCNGVKECNDGSDEEDCVPPGTDRGEDSNVAAIVAPIVVIFIVVPVVVVLVYLCKKKADEKKDEELMANRQELIHHNGGPGIEMQGFDNLGMELDDVPISLLSREEKAMSRASSQQLDGAVGGVVDVHGPPRFPQRPRETQSYRELAIINREAPPPRGTQSYRYTDDTDTIMELPEDYSPKKPRRYFEPQDRVPPGGPPYDDRPHQYRKRNEKPMTLADYRPDGNNRRNVPSGRQPPPDEDRTPEGRSFRDDQPRKYPQPPVEMDDTARSPGDGSSISRTPLRERGEKMAPKRPGEQLPGRETQSYRHPPTDYDYDREPVDRPTRSYRFQPDNPEIILKPNLHQRDARPKSRPREVSGAHKKTLGQYRPMAADQRQDRKLPREMQPNDDSKLYKPSKYDQLPDRQTQSYRVPPQSFDEDINAADELRSKSYRFAGSQSEIAVPVSPAAKFEVSGTTSV